jgi:endonuclease YncB( thermonuclease family)
MRRTAFTIAALLAVALFVLCAYYAYRALQPSPPAAPIAAGAFQCTVASVHDGDTFTCAERQNDGQSIRIRLAGVDAREVGDFCAPGHPCATAHADDATAALRRLAEGQILSCRPNGTTYGRIAAFCGRTDGTDLSCAMLAGGFVARWDRYWGDHRC